MAKILLVEDEINIASFIERGLQEFGHEVRVANDGQAGWELVQQEDFQLLILDIIMPKMNGLQLCKQYRQTYGYQSPVIMLTALGTTDDIVNGLDAGADDYLVKPFSFQELEARIKALLRRTGAEPAVPLLSCGDLTLDPSSHRAIRGKVVIDDGLQAGGLDDPHLPDAIERAEDEQATAASRRSGDDRSVVGAGQDGGCSVRLLPTQAEEVCVAVWIAGCADNLQVRGGGD